MMFSKHKNHFTVVLRLIYIILLFLYHTVIATLTEKSSTDERIAKNPLSWRNAFTWHNSILYYVGRTDAAKMCPRPRRVVSVDRLPSAALFARVGKDASNKIRFCQGSCTFAASGVKFSPRVIIVVEIDKFKIVLWNYIV